MQLAAICRQNPPPLPKTNKTNKQTKQQQQIQKDGMGDGLLKVISNQRGKVVRVFSFDLVNMYMKVKAVNWYLLE